MAQLKDTHIEGVLSLSGGGDSDIENVLEIIKELQSEINDLKSKVYRNSRISEIGGESYTTIDIDINDYSYLIITVVTNDNRSLASNIISTEFLLQNRDKECSCQYPSEYSNYQVYLKYTSNGQLQGKTSSIWDKLIVYGIN